MDSQPPYLSNDYTKITAANSHTLLVLQLFFYLSHFSFGKVFGDKYLAACRTGQNLMREFVVQIGKDRLLFRQLFIAFQAFPASPVFAH